jgi:5-formyltetrahydrofolate cyclo-ligase
VPTSALLEAKRSLRESIARRRRSISEHEREAIGGRVAAQVLALPEVERAERVAMYVALADEVPTQVLFAALRSRGRVVLLPRCAADSLHFARVDDLDLLRPGRYGVPEPPADAPDAEPGRDDLVLVPGVAFDTRGGRLGRGRSLYDRTLARLAARPLLFGVAYDFQIVEAVPMEPHDQRVDGVVTERGVVRVRSRDRSGESG